MGAGRGAQVNPLDLLLNRHMTTRTQSKASSSLFISEMNAKLEKTLRSTLKTRTIQKKLPQTMGATINNETTTTEPRPVSYNNKTRKHDVAYTN